MRTKTIPSFACGVVAWQSLEAAQQPRASAQSAPDSASERAFLDKYCVTCHSDKLHTGGLSLQSIDTSNVPAGAEIWEKVIRKIRGGAMPPQEMPRPDKAALDAFVSGIENTIDRAAAGKPNPGRAVLTGPAPIAKLAQDGGDRTLAAGATPFMRAARSADLEVMHLLLDKGADPKLANKDGLSALMLAAGIGWTDHIRGSEAEALETVKLCADLELDVTKATDKGETALHGSASDGADTILKFLVENGTNASARNKHGFTPLDIANGKDGAADAVRDKHETTAALIAQLGGTPGQEVREPAAAE